MISISILRVFTYNASCVSIFGNKNSSEEIGENKMIF